MAEIQKSIGSGAIKEVPNKRILFKIGENTVKTKNIADAAVTNTKIADSSVTEGKIADDAITTVKINNGAINSAKLADGSVTPNKLSNNVPEAIVGPMITELKEVIEDQIDDLQNQIDSLEIAGVAVSEELGDNPHISVSQKRITRELNRIWQKLEEITSEALLGFNMSITPDYVISEDPEEVSISLIPVASDEIFEHVSIYANGVLVSSESDISMYNYSMSISDTTLFRCVAKILGVEYVKTKEIKHYNNFYLGAGTSYEDIIDVRHTIPISNNMRGSYTINAEQGDNIIIVVSEGLRQGFLRADMNGVEIPFTEETVEYEGNDYVVFTSTNTYNAGNYNIDINS